MGKISVEGTGKGGIYFENNIRTGFCQYFINRLVIWLWIDGLTLCAQGQLAVFTEWNSTSIRDVNRMKISQLNCESIRFRDSAKFIPSVSLRISPVTQNCTFAHNYDTHLKFWFLINRPDGSNTGQAACDHSWVLASLLHPRSFIQSKGLPPDLCQRQYVFFFFLSHKGYNSFSFGMDD